MALGGIWRSVAVRGEPDAPERVPGEAAHCDVCGASLDASLIELTGDGYRCTFCGARHAPPGDADPVPAPPQGIGEELTRARQLLGTSLELASKETCIQERFLRALEDDESLDAFPGDVYARFFLREYAEFLGLDAGPLVAEFDETRRAPAFTLVPDPSPLPNRTGPGWRLSAVVAALALIVIAAVSSRGDGGGVQAPISPSVAPSIVPSSVADRQTPLGTHPHDQAPQHGILAVVRLHAPCYIEAVVDGRAVTPGTVQAGRSLTFRARRTLHLTLGNGGGASLAVNGKRVLTGGAGQVVHLSFSWRGDRVVRTA